MNSTKIQIPEIKNQNQIPAVARSTSTSRTSALPPTTSLPLRLLLIANTKTRGLIACSTGVGVTTLANKFLKVFAATCLSLSGALNAQLQCPPVSCMSTAPESTIEIVDTWLNTPFKVPCPALKLKPWPEIGADSNLKESSCSICCLVKNQNLNTIDIISGHSMKILSSLSSGMGNGICYLMKISRL
ncbi:putative sugar-phosphate isomerase, RpiB/LacA/LacB family [Rosa chinensis]|uniref:Putative sugar-phosphate isomerase, RpiB/LacA/LacB family n=1 Tax=Rosa chinensis TaxID=74649 RepID=A0A2P6PC46_ROSCH|nr:putative sugar-phosphate isomerase, RpiB/LacA/LacB family [Rosa chinensis]